MTNPKVVPLTSRHKVIPRGEGMELSIGNTRITFDESYLESRSDEQKRIDYELLRDACWNIIDELYERGEAV